MGSRIRKRSGIGWNQSEWVPGNGMTVGMHSRIRNCTGNDPESVGMNRNWVPGNGMTVGMRFRIWNYSGNRSEGVGLRFRIRNATGNGSESVGMRRNRFPAPDMVRNGRNGSELVSGSGYKSECAVMRWDAQSYCSKSVSFACVWISGSIYIDGTSFISSSSLMPPPRSLQEIQDEYSHFTCESYVIDTKEERTLALDAHNTVKRVWYHLNRIKAEQELRDAVHDTVKKLRNKLDLSVPSLGRYKLFIAKPRLPKDQDKEEVLIQNKTSAKPVTDNDGCHLMRRVRCKFKVKRESWKCMRCSVSSCNPNMCAKLRLQQCDKASVRMPAPSAHLMPQTSLSRIPSRNSSQL